MTDSYDGDDGGDLLNDLPPELALRLRATAAAEVAELGLPDEQVQAMYQLTPDELALGRRELARRRALK